LIFIRIFGCFGRFGVTVSLRRIRELSVTNFNKVAGGGWGGGKKSSSMAFGVSVADRLKAKTTIAVM
jgi:hypothetical protein